MEEFDIFSASSSAEQRLEISGRRPAPKKQILTPAKKAGVVVVRKSPGANLKVPPDPLQSILTFEGRYSFIHEKSLRYYGTVVTGLKDKSVKNHISKFAND